MKFTFINREQELEELDRLSKKRGLVIIYGRRRVGKTRLISHWLKKTGGLYSMAIEGSKTNQLRQLYDDIKDNLDVQVEPNSWEDLFLILDNQKAPVNLCIDEFPYLVDSDTSLPSRFQKWLDHKKSDNIFLMLSGSSQKMMHDIFLSSKSPLFGRAIKIIQIKPLRYSHFCKLLKFDPFSKNSFITFSLVGGIPKYWEYIDNTADPIENSNNLYFGFSPYMENEPHRILRDEKIDGIVPFDILESIGRGDTKPSSISGRLCVVQTNLSRPIQLLKDMSIIEREYPFGELEKNTKKTQYKIIDPSIRFWFSVYSPHRSRWMNYSRREKEILLINHASTLFEDCVRRSFEGGKRYWENQNIEFDVVRETNARELIISEVKFKELSNNEIVKIQNELEQKFRRSSLMNEYKKTKFQVIGFNSTDILWDSF